MSTTKVYQSETEDNFKYLDLSSSVEKELAMLLGKITHHIHPTIVHYITNANKTYRKSFAELCHKKCDLDAFFYPFSDCVFPGFRRPINKEKIGSWKNHVFQEDGTILNDNTFPRHIWAFLVEDKAYSGGSSGMWASSGLARFELAHIFSHKTEERSLEKSVFEAFDEEKIPYGLFSSASNVVLIPKGFAKPTDKMKSVKVCFYQRHLDLYGHNIIGLGDLRKDQVPSWYSDVEWLEPELPVDWQKKIDNLLEYRNGYLKRKYRQG